MIQKLNLPSEFKNIYVMVKCRAVVQGKIPPQNFLRAKIVAQKLQRKDKGFTYN